MPVLLPVYVCSLFKVIEHQISVRYSSVFTLPFLQPSEAADFVRFPALKAKSGSDCHSRDPSVIEVVIDPTKKKHRPVSNASGLSFAVRPRWPTALLRSAILLPSHPVSLFIRHPIVLLCQSIVRVYPRLVCSPLLHCPAATSSRSIIRQRPGSPLPPPRHRIISLPQWDLTPPLSRTVSPLFRHYPVLSFLAACLPVVLSCFLWSSRPAVLSSCPSSHLCRHVMSGAIPPHLRPRSYHPGVPDAVQPSRSCRTVGRRQPGAGWAGADGRRLRRSIVTPPPTPLVGRWRSPSQQTDPASTPTFGPSLGPPAALPSWVRYTNMSDVRPYSVVSPSSVNSRSVVGSTFCRFCLLAVNRPAVGPLSARCRPVVGSLSARYRWISGALAVCFLLVVGPCLCALSVRCSPFSVHCLSVVCPLSVRSLPVVCPHSVRCWSDLARCRSGACPSVWSAVHLFASPHSLSERTGACRVPSGSCIDQRPGPAHTTAHNLIDSSRVMLVSCAGTGAELAVLHYRSFGCNDLCRFL